MTDKKITIAEQELSDVYVLCINTFSRENCRMTERTVLGVPEKDLQNVINKLIDGYKNHDIDMSVRPLCKEQMDELRYYDSISGEFYQPYNF